MNGFRDIIEIFPSHAWLAERLDPVRPLRASAISNMSTRDSVPAKYFVRLVALAQEVGRDDVTFELLSRLAAKAATNTQNADCVSRETT